MGIWDEKQKVCNWGDGFSIIPNAPVYIDVQNAYVTFQTLFGDITQILNSREKERHPDWVCGCEFFVLCLEKKKLVNEFL